MGFSSTNEFPHTYPNILSLVATQSKTFCAANFRAFRFTDHPTNLPTYCTADPYSNLPTNPEPNHTTECDSFHPSFTNSDQYTN